MITFLVLLSANAAYYSAHPNQMSICPEKLSLINQETGGVEFVDKSSECGQLIIKSMYGRYADIIFNNDYQLSTPTAAEFTLPQFEEQSRAYILREHPKLRYELWKESAPDVILLGSSIFFCAFNRPTFYKEHLDKKLLDFTTGNNTPYIADYFMRYADSIGCKFKPNTIVLYGLNRVELLPDYKDSSAHDYVKSVISKEAIISFWNSVGNILKIPELRYDVTSAIKGVYNRVFRRNTVYRKEVAAEHIKDEESFVSYIESIAPKNNTERAFAEDRIEKIVALNDWLSSKGCKLVILKLPQSLYNDIVLNTVGQSYYDEELKKLSTKGVACADVSDLSQLNISQMDYIWPNNIFDPEHLNVLGSKKYTKALMSNLLDSLIQEKH